ncbi:hypothetical protein Tco_1426099 [Tanacetum coccineum]
MGIKIYDSGHFGKRVGFTTEFLEADGDVQGGSRPFLRWIIFFNSMGDLRIMFESKEDDELWKNQEEWKLQSWIFYENYGVHVLRLEDDLRLTVVSDDDTIFDLLRFIEKQIDEFGGQDGKLAIPEQTATEQMATGKGIPNPLMAFSLPKTIKSTELDVAVLLKRQVADQDG